MAVIETGSATNQLAVDTSFSALRSSNRPLDHGTLGHYRISEIVPLAATQTANGTLFSMRWTDTTRFCAILKVKLSCLQTVPATATIFPRFQVFVARSFTVVDSAGTAITLSGNNQKARTNMGTSLVGDMRVSAAAAGITVGTRTLDANPILDMSTQQTITTANATLYTAEYAVDVEDGGHPIVLTTNEGLIVRGPTTVFGAAGTADLVVDLTWAEVTAY